MVQISTLEMRQATNLRSETRLAKKEEPKCEFSFVKALGIVV